VLQVRALLNNITSLVLKRQNTVFKNCSGQLFLATSI